MNAGTYRPGRPINPLITDDERRPAQQFPAIVMATSIPPAPVILKDHGKRKWFELCGLILGRKILSPDFYPALENICRAYDRLLDIEGQIEREGAVIYKRVKIGPGKEDWGTVPDKAHPLQREWTSLWGAIRAGLCDFGLTPASARATNVRVNGSGPAKDTGVQSRGRTTEGEFDPV